jgi:hypothetical protein
MPTLIRPIAEASAGEASQIAIQAFNESEVLTALRNGSDNLELIAWHTVPQDFAVTRGADSGSQAGEAREVSLVLLGRNAITAVRSGSDRLLLINWSVPPGLDSIDRVWDTGTLAGEATNIAMTALNYTMLVTACRNGSGNLELISWRLESDGTISRLHDSGSLAGEVSLVTIARVDGTNVITAVRNGSGNLELIGWSVSDVDGGIGRWSQTAEAGEVFDISILPVSSGVLTSAVVTAVTDGSGNLLMIPWALSAADGTIDRVPDADVEAGSAIQLGLTSTVIPQAGRPTIVASMKRGAGDLELIGFELAADAPGTAVFLRTGDVSNYPGTSVTDTALAPLEPGRIVSAIRINNNLRVTTYAVSQVSATLIRPIAERNTTDASLLAIGAFNPNETITAVRSNSGNLLVTGWFTTPDAFAIDPGPDSGTQAGEAQGVALALLGRNAITAVRTGSGNLLLINWSVPPALASIDRVSDTGTAAGEASDIAIATISGTVMVTALRNGSGNLELISWRLETDGTIGRLHDSGAQAGEVTVVTIATVDGSNVVTAVRNGSDNLELIGWHVSPVDGTIQRWAHSAEAGTVTEIAILPFASGALASAVVTAVKDGSDNLLLIAWALDAGNGTIDRVADSFGQAGTASNIAICSTVTSPSGTPTIIVSMRRGLGNLELIAFVLIADANGIAFLRTGDMTNEANLDVEETRLASLEPGRIIAALRMNHTLYLKTYSVSDAVRKPMPKEILELEFENPELPPLGDTDWAKSAGDYPLHARREWEQVLDSSNEYDNPDLVGAAGWVVAPEDSGADVPFSHPFGFDWEFQIALDDDENGYQALLSPANTEPSQNDIALANDLGIQVPRGVLGLEWDKGLLPQSFRGRVNHGDRVAALGRWIIDKGHDSSSGFHRTEIHPPLLLATATVVNEPSLSGGKVQPFTRALFMSRPYLSGQVYAQDIANVYSDDVDDDGTLLSHMLREMGRVLDLHSTQMEAHPHIRSFPFRGRHSASFVVRPPAPDPPGNYSLMLSYRFTVRNGCQVMVVSNGQDSVKVIVTLDEAGYRRPELPHHVERTYHTPELAKLSPEAKWVSVIDVLASIVSGGIGLGSYFEYIFAHHGMQTDQYDPLPEFNILDPANGVLNIAASNIVPGAGIVLDDAQKHPVTGWLEARWIPKPRVKNPLTTVNLNEWLNATLKDPAQARKLDGKRWLDVLMSQFTVTKAQADALDAIPLSYVRGIQRAIAMVIEDGGDVHIERKSEHSPGDLYITPGGPQEADLSVGVFHCRFDANCRNWKCGWGPAKK